MKRIESTTKSCSACVLALALLLSGCEERNQAPEALIRQAQGVLAECGEGPLADRCSDYLHRGAIYAADLGSEGLDGRYDPRSDRITLDAGVLRYAPPRVVALVLLDELIHAATPGNDADAEHLVYYERQAALMRAWETAHGRGFYTCAAEDAPYERYLKERYWWRRKD
jgi:hypothetical protein